MSEKGDRAIARDEASGWGGDSHSSRAGGARYGSLFLHQIAGRDTRGNTLTICGRTLDASDPRYHEQEPGSVPVGRHCLWCWR